MTPMHLHPLDVEGRNRQAMESAELSQYLAPGLREEHLRELFESIPSDVATQLIFSAQGPPMPAMPVGGD